ncbi:MAG: polysaccharide biosynthesis/export family protein [Myxococcota bacterium]
MRSFSQSTSMRPAVLTLLCAFLLGLVGCRTPDPAPPPSAPPIDGYVVGAPDMLAVHILPEPEIEREVRVRPDGMISIDLIGDIQAAGKTPLQIAAEIKEQISRFKRDASVSVTVVDSPSQFVTVYGEVDDPGTFSLDTETRVSEAIGQVGGARPFASLNKVRVIRSNGLKTVVLHVRLGDIQKGDLSTNFVVREGDLIVVPPTGLAKVGYAVQMLLFPFQPILSGAASFGGAAAGVNR